MLVASKYEEIWAPEVRDFVYISDKAYSREQILKMEKDMLNSLQFNLTLPTCFNFLARYLKAAGAQFDKQVSEAQIQTRKSTARLVLRRCLAHIAISHYPPCRVVCCTGNLCFQSSSSRQWRSTILCVTFRTLHSLPCRIIATSSNPHLTLPATRPLPAGRPVRWLPGRAGAGGELHAALPLLPGASLALR